MSPSVSPRGFLGGTLSGLAMQAGLAYADDTTPAMAPPSAPASGVERRWCCAVADYPLM